MQQRYLQIIRQGIYPETSPGLAKLILLSNSMILLSSFTLWCSALMFVSSGHLEIPIMAAIFGSFQPVLILFNRFRKYELGWFVFILLNSFIVFFFSTILPAKSGVYWYYSLVLFTTYIVFFQPIYANYRWWAFTFILTLGILDLGLHLHPFGMIPVKAISIKIAQIGIPTFCFLLMMGYINYFMRGTYRYEAKLAKQNNSLRKQNMALEKVNRELDKFLYYASHDLRAPVASTQGLITLARDSQSLEEIRHYLDLQEKSLDKLDVLIRDILDYNWNKKNKISEEEIDFDQLIRKTFAETQTHFQGPKISMQLSVEQKDPFFSDPVRLKMILANLFSNALQYHDGQKEAALIDVAIETFADHASIQIRDNGEGIRPDIQDKVFNMFFRGSNRSQGTGLGLFLVRETTQRLGGQIDVDSVLGEGTTFKIALPNAKDARQTVSAA